MWILLIAVFAIEGPMIEEPRAFGEFEEIEACLKAAELIIMTTHAPMPNTQLKFKCYSDEPQGQLL